MKINWKVRVKNPMFVAQIILAIGVPLTSILRINSAGSATIATLDRMVAT